MQIIKKITVVAAAVAAFSCIALAYRPEISRGSSSESRIKPIVSAKKVTAPSALPAKASGSADNPSLLGLMIYSSGWKQGRATGIYSINPSNGTTTLVHAVPEVDGNGSIAGTIADGIFYGSYCEDFYGNISVLRNYAVDLTTGKTDVYTYPTPTYNDVVANMTYDSASQTIYSINHDGGTQNYNLTTFNPADNSYTVIGPLQEHYYAICADSRDHLYAINDLGAVVEINPADGTAVRTVAETNIEPRYSQSCTWSPKDQLIYWAACNDNVASLVTIDPATGEVATATAFPHDEEFVALTCTDPAVDAGAPAAPTDLKITYAAPGATEATVTLTVPTLTAGGQALTAQVDVTVQCDGVTIASGSTTPGATFTVDVNLAEGTHRIAAYCSNAYGNGPRLTVVTFAGSDHPAAVSDLSATVTDTRNVALRWTAPVSGENGGWFDPSLVTYNIIRNGETIVRNITATGFTDHLDDCFATNVYYVETGYAGQKCGLSNGVQVNTGDHLALPYANDFENEGDFGLLTVIDHNADGNTWFHDTDYNTASYNFSRTKGGDDYLVLPMIRGERGHVYRLEFFTRSASLSYPDKLAVVCGNAPDAGHLNRVLMDGRVISNEGENLSLECAVNDDGPLYFAFHCVSDADMSRLFVDDIKVTDCGRTTDPAPVTNLTATPAADGALTVDLGFTAPTATLAGAPLASLDKIEISRDGQLIHTIASPAPGSTHRFTDTGARFGFNTYSVVATSDGSGVNSASVTVFAGIYTLPFSVTPTREEYSLFTIPGGEKDDTWYYDTGENALKVTTYSYRPTDTYIFSPAIELTDANMIELSFNYRGGLSSCTESLEVTFGTTPDPSTHTAVSRLDFSNTDYLRHTARFPVEKAGRYYIGFHAVSDPDQMMILVRDITLQRGALMTAPGAPTATSVKGGPAGALTAEVSFTLPTAALDGTPLQGKIGARLYRADGTVASSVDGLMPGATASLTDGAALPGINAYTVVTFNDDGEGGRADCSGWIGTDIPNPLTYLEALPSADNMLAELSWGAPTTGLHDGWIDPVALTYNIYQLQDNALYLIESTSKTSIAVSPQGDGQDFYTFYVTAVSEAGESRAMSTGLVVGPPYELPMTETASNRIVTCLPWIAGPVEGNVNWGVADYIGSLDLAAADGGMFVCSAGLPERRPGIARMQLPKLVFNGLKAPTLAFKMFHYDVPGGELKVSITTDEVNYATLFTAATDSKSQGWEEYSVDLSQYSSAPWVAIVFDGILTNGAAYVIVDDIEVANRSKYDLLVQNVTGSISPEAGIEAPYQVIVKNAGSESADFNLVMKINGVAGSTVENQSVAGGSSVRCPLTFATLPEHIGTPVEVEIEAVMLGHDDEIPANNVARFNISVIQPELPVVTDLKADGEAGRVNLSWSAPSLDPEPFTDTFNEYESFAINNIGDYKTVDNDGLTPCGIQGVEFPNMGTPMAFQVWEPKADGVGVDAEIWQPRSGNKCLVAWTSLSTYSEPYNDDWLISPLLYVTETPQPLNFYVRRPVGTYGSETFEVLYSTTGDTPDDFTLLKRETVSNDTWNLCSYSLPAGARHFAIRYTSRDRFALLFDDLTYTVPSPRSEMRIDGFNVYRNGLKIGQTSASSPSYTVDNETDASARYNVNVCYDRGESRLSNTAILPSGLDVIGSGSAVTVRGCKGYIAVAAPAGVEVRVTAVGGIVMYQGEPRPRIDLPAGIYIVEAGSTTAKVSVK